MELDEMMKSLHKCEVGTYLKLTWTEKEFCIVGIIDTFYESIIYFDENEEEYDEFYACAIRVKEVLNKTEMDNITENELIEISKYNCPNEIMLLNGLSIWRG